MSEPKEAVNLLSPDDFCARTANKKRSAPGTSPLKLCPSSPGRILETD
ncbi:unnamed protein product, partial [Heterotrigona itama]